MLTKAQWVACLMLTVPLAGCNGASEPTTATASSSTLAGPATTTGTLAPNGTSGPANAAPVATLAVLLNGTALEPVNGSIPAVEGDLLTFSASASHDPDGDPLTYAWEFGGDNTSTNETVELSFPPGTISVVLTVSDGKATDMANVTLSIAALPPPFERFTKSGALTMTDNMTNTGYTSGGMQGDRDDLYFPVKEGAKYVFVLMTYTKFPNQSGQNYVYLDLYLYNAKGERKWTRGSDPMPMIVRVVEADIITNGFGTWKAQASCFTCANTNYSLEVRVYYREPLPK